MIYETDEREEDGLTCGGFDDCGFADTGCVKIDICALLCRLFLDVKI